MSIKSISLGNIGAVANGIVVSGATNATPIVVTLNAGHGLKNGDRIAITAVTGNTAANGEWTLDSVTATTAKLLGSVGNGAYGAGGTVAVICDTTPTMKGHAVQCLLNSFGVGVATAPVATVLIEGSDDNAAFANVLKDVAGAYAVTTARTKAYEIDLKKYMRLRASAYTSGTVDAQILA